MLKKGQKIYLWPKSSIKKVVSWKIDVFCTLCELLSTKRLQFNPSVPVLILAAEISLPCSVWSFFETCDFVSWLKMIKAKFLFFYRPWHHKDSYRMFLIFVTLIFCITHFFLPQKKFLGQIWWKMKLVFCLRRVPWTGLPHSAFHWYFEPKMPNLGRN